MNIEHLRAFLEIASLGSFQLAADRLSITQSTISARIKSLEDRLNRALFLRKRNGAQLTSAGHQMLPHAQTIVRTWERANQEIGLPDGLSAMLNMGIQINHWHRIAPPWLEWMENHMPEVATQIASDTSDNIMRKMRDGLLDMAILYEPQHCLEVTIEPLFTEKLVMVSNLPRKVQHGPVHDYIFVDWGHDFRIQHAIAFPGAPTHRLSVGMGAVALDHILKQGGSGYLPDEMVAPYLKDGELHLVDQAPTFERLIYLAYQTEPTDPDLHNEIVNAVRLLFTSPSPRSTP